MPVVPIRHLLKSALLEFFAHESMLPWRPVIVMATLSGIANGILLVVINAAAGATSHSLLSLRFLLIFLLAFLLFYYTKHYAMTRSTEMVEQLLRAVRIRLADKIRGASLPAFDSLGRELFHTRITQDATTISQAAPILINACQAAIMLFFAAGYILHLSLEAFVITVVAVGGSILIYLTHYQQVVRQLQAVDRKEQEFVSLLHQMMDGFKELKLNQGKSDDLFARFTGIAGETERLKSMTGALFVTRFMFAQVAFYLLLACLIFLVPRFSPIASITVIKLTAAILFIMGPLITFTGAIPYFANANHAAKNLQGLEQQLDAVQAEPEKVSNEGLFSYFSTIRFEDIQFSYTDSEGGRLFTLGPLTAELHRGELLFLVGGNGSGKSTLLKLLCGLYEPTTGTVQIDGKPLSGADITGYRSLFAAIFNDFHLFDRLYGIGQPDIPKVQGLLKEMGLDNKTDFVDQAFTNLQLSTGQRKRLALIAALLDDRPVYLFDEVAADQDPAFRHYFYETFLAGLKSAGKTVIVVSHDEHYFPVADRVLRMDYGTILREGV